MRNVAAQVGLVVAVVALAGGTPAKAQQNPGAHMNVDEFRLPLAPLGQMVPPSIKLLIGTWKFNPEASRFENVLEPKEATRTYKDLGNGSYSCNQVVYSLEGGRSETQYVGKDDGMLSPLLRADDAGKLSPTSVTISFRWIDDHMAEQTEIDHEVIAVSKREISPDGKTMVQTLPTNGHFYVHMHADDPVPDIAVWAKVMDKK